MPSGSALDTEQYTEKMAAICDGLVSRYGATLLFIPQCTYQHGDAVEDDRVVGRRIVDRMQHPNEAIMVTQDLTVEQCLSLYSQAEVGLCTRLHANVYAAIQGVPPVAISYLPKVDSFMHWLGHGDLTVSLPELAPEQVLDKVATVLAERKNLSRAILTRVEAGRTEVEQYAEIACDLMERGRSR
jgi:polysaccharide pyruvyl transferase WcaK-like protein